MRSARVEFLRPFALSHFLWYDFLRIRAIGAAASAGALHAQGRGFKSLIAHQKSIKPSSPRLVGFLFMRNTRGDVTVCPYVPIGVFDSGLGGLTVARALSEGLPQESILYVGDTKRCPYGPRDQAEVRDFAREIAGWLVGRNVKMIVIACNTATAASLEVLQHELSIPVIGVIEPGARAAVKATRTGTIGVLATQGTVQSKSYVRALQKLDPDAHIIQCAAPRFVQLVEETLAHAHRNAGCTARAACNLSAAGTAAAPSATHAARTSELFENDRAKRIVQETLEPLRGQAIDTVVLGCTHFPLLATQIQQVLGPDVVLVNPAEETVRCIQHTLSKLGELADKGAHASAAANASASAQTSEVPSLASQYRFATTSDKVDEFAHAGAFIFGKPLGQVEHIALSELEKLRRY